MPSLKLCSRAAAIGVSAPALFTGRPSAQVWEAIQELKAEAAWKVGSIVQLATAFEAQLATGQPHNLPALQAPKQPPIDPSLSASEVAYPGFPMLHTTHTMHAGSSICSGCTLHNLPEAFN